MYILCVLYCVCTVPVYMYMYILYCVPVYMYIYNVYYIVYVQYMYVCTYPSLTERLLANITDYPKRIAPKVLYTPNNTVTNNIMEYANMTFEAIQLLLNMLEQVDNCSATFVGQNPPNGDLASQLDTIINNPLLGTLSGLDQSTLSNLESLLEVGSPRNIWNRTEELHEYVVLIEQYVGVVDWDVFLPIDTEEEVIDISFDKDLQTELGISSVFAGECGYGSRDYIHVYM